MLWAVGVTIQIWRMPRVVSETCWVVDGSEHPELETVETVRSFAEVTGSRGAGFLAAFVALNSLGAWSLWRRHLVAATALAMLGLGLSFVTGFSIGRAFWPAAWCLAVGVLIGGLATAGRSDR